MFDVQRSMFVPCFSMIARRNIMLGTAGHVDHGKTTLVKLLTG